MYSPAPQVSFGPAGEAIAVWSLLDGSNVIVGTSSSRDGGETWGPVTNLSAAGQDGQSPQISIDDAGNAVAVWTFYDGVNYVVQGSSSNDGGATWAAAVDLSVTAPGVSNPQVGFDAAGNAVAIWSLYDGSNVIAQTSSSRDGGVTWDSATDLSVGQNAQNPQVSFDAAGNAIAVWSLYDGSDSFIQSRSSSDGGATWGSVVTLSAAGQGASNPQVSFDAAGHAIAIWAFYDSSNYIVQTRSSSDGGATWAPVVELSAVNDSVYNPQVSFDAAGHAIAIWALYDSGDYIIQTRSSSDGGATWSSIVDFSDFVQSGNNPQVGFDAFGNALAVWSGYNGSDYVVQARSSADAGATWGNVSNLSATGSDGYNPQLSFDASGNALAIWYLYEGTEYIIQSSALPAPALPDTGVSPAMTGTFAAIGAGLLAGGFAALLVVRRRLAGK